MLIDLVDTNAAKINNALVAGRRSTGSPALGLVLTLVIATTEQDHYDALRAATEAAREHPSRVLVAIRRPGRTPAKLDAEVRMGGETGGPGEVVLLRMYGELADHADSVVLPLLLPDAPVVAWWPGDAPRSLAKDPLGALAQRRVTDATAGAKPLAELAHRAETYAPGDTDLAWTRITTWRTMLASALDEPYGTIGSVQVTAEPQSPSAALLAGWLGAALGVPVEERTSDGPGITEVVLVTSDGPISITRSDGRSAALRRPGQPERSVALPRRHTWELIAEEMRRLDPDDTYGRTLRLVAAPEPAPRKPSRDGSTPRASSARSRAGRPAAREPRRPSTDEPAVGVPTS